MPQTRSQTASSATVTETTTEPAVVLRLHGAPETSERQPRIRWAEETVDNEGMGKKKSKCCCIYKKAKKWDESSDEDADSDCETGHCRGHVEKKAQHSNDSAGPSASS